MSYNLRKRKDISYNINNTFDDILNTHKSKKRKTTHIIDNLEIYDSKPNDSIINRDLWKDLMEYQNVGSNNIPEIDDWVSATKTRNYLLRDPFIDWLDHWYAKLGYNDILNSNLTKEKKEEFINTVTIEQDKKNVLFEMGNIFEQKVFENITNKYKSDTVMICKNREEYKDRKKVNDTLYYMQQGTPIILQAMLVNNINKTFGVADILLRSDYVNKIFNNNLLVETVKAPLLNGNYYYVVIDIKWSTIPLCANKRTILNTDKFLAYKGQLAIYNLALGCMQGYIPNTAYILGKAWKCSSLETSGNNCFDMPGIIDYAGFDRQYIDLTTKAIKWIRDMRVNGSKWSCLRPERDEMYPNMCSQDSCWEKVKQDVSNNIKELTKLWMVGYKNRNYAHTKGILRWDDPKCSAKNLKINGQKISPILDTIIKINRDSTNIIVPTKIKNNYGNWQAKSDLDFYIDFETFNKCFLETNIDIKHAINSNIIFMIGVGYIDDDKFKYKSFILDTYTLENEQDTLNRFIKFIEDRINIVMKKKNIRDRNKVRPRLFHWANAEKTFLDLANTKFGGILTSWIKSVDLIDLCRIFTSEPIVIKGMFKFKLKEVASVMYNHGMIKTCWKFNTSSGVSDGFSAMMDAVKYYRTAHNILDDDLPPIINDIVEYNYVDCKVLWEIITYLRENNI
jgi:hypothetical protein